MYFPTIKSKMEINFKYSTHQGRLVFGPLEPEAAGLSPLLWATSSHGSPSPKSTLLLAQLCAVSGTGCTWVWILAPLLTVVRCWRLLRRGQGLQKQLCLCVGLLPEGAWRFWPHVPQPRKPGWWQRWVRLLPMWTGTRTLTSNGVLESLALLESVLNSLRGGQVCTWAELDPVKKAGRVHQQNNFYIISPHSFPGEFGSFIIACFL